MQLNFEFFNSLDHELPLKLKYVRIYFDAITFDIITKDKAAKFVDMLSVIGGTMGLLTGFSIINGVEVIYFIVKIIINVFLLLVPVFPVVLLFPPYVQC